MVEFWEARATYNDGYEISKKFPYPFNEKNEEEQQYEIEEWLLSIHDGCNWYSVNYVQE